jgi:hypothetical protein
MPSPPALKQVIGGVAPELRRLAFKRFGPTFNREVEPGLVHVVGFQASQSGDKFTVNLGVYVREVDAFLHDWWGRSGKSGRPGRDSSVRDDVCLLRARLGRAASRGDAWWSYAEPESAVKDLAKLLVFDAEAAFAEVADRTLLVGWWSSRLERPPLWGIEGPTPLGFALLLKEMGRTEDARRIVEDACRDAAGRPFFHMVSVWAEDLGFDCP